MIGEIKFYSISNEYILCGYKIENTNVLPDDIVEYQINNGAIDITKLIYRHQLITIAIINEYSNFYLPIYETKLINTLMIHYEFGMRLIIKIDLNGITIIKQYDFINNRQIDAEIVCDLYMYINDAFNIPIPKKLLQNNTNDSILKLNMHELNQSMLDTFTIFGNSTCVQSEDIDNAFSICNNIIYVHTINICKYININSDMSFIKSNSIHFGKYKNVYLFDNHNDINLNEKIARHVITLEINTETNRIFGPYQSIICVKNHYTYDDFNCDLYPVLKKYININMFWNEINIPIRELAIDEFGYMTDIYLRDANNFNLKIVETLLIKMNIYISNLIDIDLKFKKKIKLTNPKHNHKLSYAQSISKSRQKNKCSSLSQISYATCTSPLNKYYDIIIQRLLYGIKYDNVDELLEYLNFRSEIYNQIIKLYESWKIDTFIETTKVNVEYIKLFNEYYLPEFIYELNEMNPLHKYIISRDFNKIYF